MPSKQEMDDYERRTPGTAYGNMGREVDRQRDEMWSWTKSPRSPSRNPRGGSRGSSKGSGKGAALLILIVLFVAYGMMSNRKQPTTVQTNDSAAVPAAREGDDRPADSPLKADDSPLKAGDLVTMTRATAGLSTETVGTILRREETWWVVEFHDADGLSLGTLSLLPRDLKLHRRAEDGGNG
jgi:hypothetical protein